MPKKGQNVRNLRPVQTPTAFLLVQFILLKIGESPILLIKLLIFFIKSLAGIKLPEVKFPTIKMPALSIRFPKFSGLKRRRIGRPKINKEPSRHFLLSKKHAGRPRKKWLIPYYLAKFKLYVRRRVPKKVKLASVLGTFLFLLFSYTVFVLNTAYQLPSPERLVSTNKPLTTEFFDRNGALLYRLYEGRNRSLINLDEVPQNLINATIAIEDKNFYKHSGVDLEAIARAIINDIKYKKQEGASTITQQLIKNTLLTPEKTYVRKIKEGILAIWAETKYSKNQILQMYFNETPYGGITWGIKAASQTFFYKEPKDLSLAEAAYLAGLPASPTEFSPYGTHPQLGFERQKQVLRRMVEEKYITEGEEQEALSQKLEINAPQNNIKAPHFVYYIKDVLSQKYGPRVVSQGGLKIYTTLDLNLQEVVEDIVSDEVANLSSLNVNNGAAMVTDPKSGEILSMVGSKNFDEPQFGNYNATIALRQPGSSIKPITYATAFKLGYSPGNTILDAPVVFKDEWGNKYAPVNYDGKFHGPVSIRVALGSSLNIPAVKTLSTAGMDNMIQTSRDLGITTFTEPKKYGLSLTLGGAEVKMIDMMGAYGAFSQTGKLIKPVGVLKVTDSSGNILEEYQKQERQALSPAVAYLISSILSDNNARTMAFGANSLLNLPGVAVKTGTTDSKRDNWTFGYTPDFVVGVWVGNNDNSPMDPRLASGITGAAPIWNKITRTLLSIHPSLGFVQPEGVVLAQVDGRKDLVVSSLANKGMVKVITEGDRITFSDTFSSISTSSAQAAGTTGTN